MDATLTNPSVEYLCIHVYIDKFTPLRDMTLTKHIYIYIDVVESIICSKAT